jgi:hypothetical protein
MRAFPALRLCVLISLFASSPALSPISHHPPTRPGAATKQKTTKITKAPKKLEDQEENNNT